MSSRPSRRASVEVPWEPEKEVVKTIKTAITYPFKVLGIRGGSDEADEEDEDDVDVDEEASDPFA